MRRVLLAGLLLMALLGCSLAAQAAPPAQMATVVGPAFSPIPTLTSGPAPATAPVTVAPTPAATYVPFSVVTGADNLALRKGPGYLFGRIGLLLQGVSVRVLGLSRGGEWALVQTEDNRVGWIFIQLLGDHGTAWSTVPFSDPLGAQLIQGVVKDQAGQAISGIQFAFTQGSGSVAPRNDAITDATGTFYAYMPAEAYGKWYVSYTAIACTSNTMDASCNPKNGVGGRPYPEGEYITLPLSPPTVLQFVWK